MKLRSYLCAVLTITFMAGCQPPDTAGKRSAAGRPASVTAGDPVWSLDRLDGSGQVNLASWRGAPLLLYIMAPWTDARDAALEELQKLDAAGLRALPVLVDRRPAGGRDAVRMPVLLSGLPPVYAHDALLEELEGIRALPTAVLLDESGKVVRRWPGHVPASQILADTAPPARDN